MNSKQTEADYVPYGPEWEKEMSKFPKLQLIKMLGKAYQEKKELKQSLPSKPVGDVEESDYAAAPQKGMKEVDHEAEKEVMMQAFDKVYKIFQARTWVMEGRGSYRYDDDRYKEEVRYLFDEFDAIHKDTWKNIKSKSADFRLKVIEQYKKDLKNPYIRLSETGTLDESPSPSEAGDEIEIIDGYTQLAIDKRSLPKDGQHVKFMTENEEFHEGYFVGGDDIFHVTDSKFFFKWHVQQWKVI